MNRIERRMTSSGKVLLNERQREHPTGVRAGASKAEESVGGRRATDKVGWVGTSSQGKSKRRFFGKREAAAR